MDIFFYQIFLSNYLSKDSEMVQSLIVITCIVLEKKAASYYLSVPLLIHFSFSPMNISVADFSIPIGASVLKLCVHLQLG